MYIINFKVLDQEFWMISRLISTEMDFLGLIATPYDSLGTCGHCTVVGRGGNQLFASFSLPTLNFSDFHFLGSGIYRYRAGWTDHDARPYLEKV